VCAGDVDQVTTGPGAVEFSDAGVEVQPEAFGAAAAAAGP